MKVLIIANARYKGGLSGSDAIYDNFIKYWPAKIETWQMLNIDFKPFAACYFLRIICGIFKALFCFKKYDFVYSASDFLMDSIPALIMKFKGNKWVAGFYLIANQGNYIYFKFQFFVWHWINMYADMVIVSNESMYPAFKEKKKTWINGGIDLTLSGKGEKEKLYDAVFCGRIHPSKGIDELIKIWAAVRKYKPDASLAIIGDGDLGKEYIEKKLLKEYDSYMGIRLFGYLGDERYKIYKQSKIVLYPATWNHFSLAPVEAMACGCPIVTFCLKAVLEMRDRKYIDGMINVDTIESFVHSILYLLEPDKFGDKLYWTDKKRITYEDFSLAAYESAQFWDYKKQVMRVWDDIERELKENWKG